VAALVSYGLAGLLALTAAARAFAGRRSADGARRRLSEGEILAGATAAVAEARKALGRSASDDEALGRALGALRVVGAGAVGHPAAQTPAGTETKAATGQLRLRGGWLRGHVAVVSSPTTAADITKDLNSASVENAARRAQMEALRDALIQLTEARYGQSGTLDMGAVDDALGHVVSLGRDLAREHGWIARQRRAWTLGLQNLKEQVWTR
jgi:hypothetical protein